MVCCFSNIVDFPLFIHTLTYIYTVYDTWYVLGAFPNAATCHIMGKLLQITPIFHIALINVVRVIE